MAGLAMTRDDIIRMAREAGLFVPQAGIPENGALMRFAALVAAAEREACAKVCDHMARRCNDMRAAALEVAAESIRARGQE